MDIPIGIRAEISSRTRTVQCQPRSFRQNLSGFGLQSLKHILMIIHNNINYVCKVSGFGCELQIWSGEITQVRDC